ncbi:MAG TPA: sigma-70 family RNA polymerase sigma factor [Polyangia bacterium]
MNSRPRSMLRALPPSDEALALDLPLVGGRVGTSATRTEAHVAAPEQPAVLKTQASPVPATAEALEAAALAGDTRAWQALIARHERKVVVALLARGIPIDRARELAQETWLRLMERQRRGQLVALTLPGLAIVQAGFLAANERRGPRAQIWSSEAVAVEEAVTLTQQHTAEDTVIGRQRLSVVSDALAACPSSARRVFEFVYAHPELGYNEVAARFALSTQRVKQIVFEVRARLRDALAEADR